MQSSTLYHLLPSCFILFPFAFYGLTFDVQTFTMLYLGKQGFSYNVTAIQGTFKVQEDFIYYTSLYTRVSALHLFRSEGKDSTFKTHFHSHIRKDNINREFIIRLLGCLLQEKAVKICLVWQRLTNCPSNITTMPRIYWKYFQCFSESYRKYM